MSIGKLAAELLRQIFGHVQDYNDLNNAGLVCRSWLPLCREIAWSRIALNLDSDLCSKLATVLQENEKTTIPRQIRGITIDEYEVLEYAEEDEVNTWREDLLVALSHFNSISQMTIRFLDLTKFSRPIEQILRPDTVAKTLVIQQVTAQRASDLVPYILGNPRLHFLGLGKCTFVEKDGGAVESRPPTESSHLTRMRHLVIFGECGELLPFLMDSPSLSYLTTLVAVCNDNDAIPKLVDAALPSLRSLALGFANDESTFDLSRAESLQNLSIDIAGYPKMGKLLENLVQTVSSIPTVEHLFINCGPNMVQAESTPASADSLWKALDTRLSQLPGLEYVAFTMVIESCIAMFMGQGNQLGGVFESWKKDLLKYAEDRLPVCREEVGYGEAIGRVLDFSGICRC